MSISLRFPLAASPFLAPVVRILSNAPWRRLLGLWGAAMVAGVSIMRVVLERMYTSVIPLPPTDSQLNEEDMEANPLYRAFPALRGKLAWRQLGDFATPVHRFVCALPGSGNREAHFWVKREDLSSSRYGGNKVRTLQYQLAAFEAHIHSAGHGETALMTFGSGGSNQVVATKVHAALTKLPSKAINGFTPMPDEPEMDNTLNYLSSLSLPGKHRVLGTGMGALLAALGRRRPNRPWVLMPGGNGPLGVLGNAGAMLELAEQITRRELPDPDGVVIAVGSCCTTTGLVLGVALARAAGLDAFKRPGFRIYAQPVHPGMQMMQRLFRVLTTESLPMMIGRGIKEAAAIIAAHGGPDVTGAALRVMREELVFSFDSSITGKYGAHSNASRSAKSVYDTSVKEPPGMPHLWLCGHFTAKSFALLLKLLESGTEGDGKNYVFWQTKSLIQPRGPQDEWDTFQAEVKGSKLVKKWGIVGGVTGHPSAIATSGLAGEAGGGFPREASGPEDYRALMTPLTFPA